jgi:hypothetical protein
LGKRLSPPRYNVPAVDFNFNGQKAHAKDTTMSQSLKQRVVSLGRTACRWIAFGFGYDPIQALLDAPAGRSGRNFSTP